METSTAFPQSLQLNFSASVSINLEKQRIEEGKVLIARAIRNRDRMKSVVVQISNLKTIKSSTANGGYLQTKTFILQKKSFRENQTDLDLDNLL